MIAFADGSHARHSLGRALTAAMAALLALSAAALPAVPTSQPLPDPADDIVFREALRARGLHAWAALQAKEHAPDDVVAAQLNRREKLLAGAGVAGFAVGTSAGRGSSRRFAGTQSAPAADQDPMTEASQILIKLLADHPSHPGRYRWQYELARDYLERVDPSAFENLLVYELPGREQEIVRDLSRRAIEVLSSLRREIADAWKSVEVLDEPSLAALRDSGGMAGLEAIDARSSVLLTWAKLHQALTAELDQQTRAEALSQVLEELSASGRVDLPAGREAEQAGALLMAAVAERRLGRYDQADSRARQIIALLGRISDKPTRDRLRQTALIAVLEQIRAVRDAGRYDAALQAVKQAREWAIKGRPDQPQALVAVSLLEVSVLHRKQLADGTAADQGGVGWLDCEACLSALEGAARQSVAHRNLIYEVLAPALAATPMPKTPAPFALQLMAGSSVHDARTSVISSSSRLEAVLQAVRQALASSDARIDSLSRGELKYLLGQGLAATDAGLEAVQVLTDLAEKDPGHDRAEAAIRQAVTLAGRELRRSGPSGSPASRGVFVRAVRVMRMRVPTDPTVPELTYAVGVALENDDRFEEAAGEYSAVPAGHGRSQDAALGRIRCWRRVLESAGANHASTQAVERGLIDRARAAVQAVREQFPELGANANVSVPATTPADPDTNGCSRGRLVLAVCELLNHPALGGAEDAVALSGRLTDVDCPELLGPALRQRILGLRQLKRLSEARQVVDEYLVADPNHAGAAMAGLLQSMHAEILALRERGDEPGAATVAAEAVQVGESLLAWGAERPGRLQPVDRLVIRTWHASALLQAGRSDEALAAFGRIEQDGKGVLPEDSGTFVEVRLGKADATLESGRAGDALPMFVGLWQTLPEHSPSWWHAFVGSLRCHVQLESGPAAVLSSIRQQRFLAPDLGGARWQREISRVEQLFQARAASRPAP